MQARIQREGSRGFNPLFSNRCGSIILYHFIRKEKKISNAIDNCYQVNLLFLLKIPGSGPARLLVLAEVEDQISMVDSGVSNCSD